MIAIGGALKVWRRPSGFAAVRAIRHGRRAAWLLGEDYERLLAEPLETARQRLNIHPAAAYQAVR